MKRALRLNSRRLHTLGLLCRFASAQSSKLSVPLNGKYTQQCLRQCRVSVAMAVGLLVGWTVLELHQHPVSCVAEPTETAECHDNKEQTHRQCQVVSLDEAIYESDQLLQRVKVREKLRPYSIWIQFHSESEFGFAGKSNGLDSWALSLSLTPSYSFGKLNTAWFSVSQCFCVFGVLFYRVTNAKYCVLCITFMHCLEMAKHIYFSLVSHLVIDVGVE